MSDDPNINLPDDLAFETARLTIVAYVAKDGSTGYAVSTRGDSQMTTYLGLTIVAQDHIKEWGSE